MSNTSDTLPTTLRARKITLALEGGGALGAFAWGALDRLLEHPELHIEIVGGTSAGAMNGAMLARHSPDWSFLSNMHKLGAAAADRWLLEHKADVGTRSSLNLCQFTGVTDPGTINAVAAE